MVFTVSFGALAVKPALADQKMDRNAVVQRPAASVVVIKTDNVKAFQDVTEAFRESCRVSVKVVHLKPNSAEQIRLARDEAAHATLVVAVGQPAAEAARGLRAKIVYAMIPAPPPGIGNVGTHSTVGPREALPVLRQLRPSLRHVGVIYSRAGLAKMVGVRAAARELGIELQQQLVENSPDAIRAIHKMVNAETADSRSPRVEALWVGPDLSVVDMPLVQFLLTVQLTAQVPILVGTRQLVSHGLLLSIDWSPAAVGKHLGDQVNKFLEAPDHLETSRDTPDTLPEVIINGPAARRLNLDIARLTGLGWKVHE